MREFDAYLMVDWSASSVRKTGADSIWYCLLTRTSGGLVLEALNNPATRRQAVEELREILRRLAGQKKMVLAGFDFPFGYPAGFATRMGWEDLPPWQAVWRELVSQIIDRQDNTNNRFQVAASLNQRASTTNYPFWGCPESARSTTMSSTKGEGTGLAENRLTDVGNMQPIWKLFGNGSVGSQALLGIPAVAALRNDPVLAAVSSVWPFETGLVPLPERQQRAYLILHAEIYPSLLQPEPAAGEVKDSAQVRAMAAHFAALDEAGELNRLFAGPERLTPSQREHAEREEGWTLGVLSSTPFRPQFPIAPAITQPRPKVTPSMPEVNTRSATLPLCDFVYFATPACGTLETTMGFVYAAQAIIAHAYNSAEMLMPLVLHLRPGHRILVAYGSNGQYTPILSCELGLSRAPVVTSKHTLDVFCDVPEALHPRLRDTGYSPDPFVRRFVGISVAAFQDLSGSPHRITKPKGNNTLRRWAEVFPG